MTDTEFVIPADIRIRAATMYRLNEKGLFTTRRDRATTHQATVILYRRRRTRADRRRLTAVRAYIVFGDGTTDSVWAVRRVGAPDAPGSVHGRNTSDTPYPERHSRLARGFGLNRIWRW